MTCIIGYIDKTNNIVYMGGDSAYIKGNSIDNHKDKKVFQKGNFLIGVSGYERLLGILKYSFNPPDKPENMLIEEYMNTLFVNSLRDCLKNNGFSEKDKEKESFDSTILIGYQNRLFEISCDYNIIESERNFISIGCGQDFAKGALLALEGIDINIEKNIYKALQITGNLDCYVNEPYYVLKLKK